jgi:16S rRNA U516 pseudouridylate synthase RsuA-like enzyme
MEVLMLDNGKMAINMGKVSTLIQKEYYIKVNGNKVKRADMEK